MPWVTEHSRRVEVESGYDTDEEDDVGYWGCVEGGWGDREDPALDEPEKGASEDAGEVWLCRKETWRLAINNS